MKKILKLGSQITLVSGLPFSVVACSNLLGGGSGEVRPPDPPIKDVEYYQALIEEMKDNINDCQEVIEDIKNSKDDYEDEREYQSDIDEVSADQYSYQTLINEYQYQILLLEKENEEFSPDQILKGIEIFTDKIFNLEQELDLRKNLYPDPASDAELQEIKNDIKVATDILKMFEKLKGEEE